jgi:hypothetical protein
MMYVQRNPGSVPKNPCDGAHTQHVHEWVVFSTALKERALLVQCVDCGAIGTVDDPTREEWSEAFHAPERPYRWHDESRVTLRRGPNSEP